MMNKILRDESQRQTAIDPRQSFIVHAPAGSGKTELLTQRFLCLLSYAEKNPEEILALTFTRKAASEMRDRIVRALTTAKTSTEPEEMHAKRTWYLARKVLKRDEKDAWHLLENPNRLRIQTIDALCASLTYQMPILSRFGAQPTVAENPQILYQKAVQAIIEQLDNSTPWQNALSQLLRHLDNRVNVLEKLLIHMLGKRDQWLPHIIKAKNQSALRETLEAGLSAITEDALEKLNAAIPAEHLDEILHLAQFSANIRSIAIDQNDTKTIWTFIGDLLLTTKGEFRKTVNIKHGFPTKQHAKNKIEAVIYSELKDRMKNLLEALKSKEDFKVALFELRHVPPTQYNKTQWETIDALLIILPVAAAQLQLIFQQEGLVDFIEIAQAALTALGDNEKPTDLALALDYQIRHVLVDEFQDTSITQFHLIQQLTAEWMPNDGRTLFLVGDPMQSIYRFRNAEVGLFLRACHEGISNIKPTVLRLTSNFRSDEKVLNWINQTFEKTFPITEDISAGAVTYNSGITNKTDRDDAGVSLHPLTNADEFHEATLIASIIKQHQQKHPKDKIAILVKARSHLTKILPTLRQHELAYQAIEIENLNTSSIIQDLLALTKALLHLGDRIAWLSILRAPWCGLTLNDLHIIANANADTTIFQNITNNQLIEQLSKDGKSRLNAFRIIIEHAFQQKRNLTLREWINQTFLHLNQMINLNQHKEDIQTYFDLLETLTVSNDIKDFALLEKRVNTLFAKINNGANDNLQVMTIHKAKGLEFDVVIIPGLERFAQNNYSELLLWAERPRTHCQNDLVLAPIKAFQEASDPIYQYLNYEDSIKTKWEDIRLFYVAATRAKRYLHLTGNMTCDLETGEIKKPRSNSFLNYIWHTVESDFMKAASPLKIIDEEVISNKNDFNLTRLPIAAMQTNLLTPTPISSLKHRAFKLELNFNRKNNQIVGTIIHQILDQIARDGLSQWNTAKIEATKQHWKALLLRSGILPENIDSSLKDIVRAINNTLADPKGQWILQKHQQEKSEFSISTHADGKLKKYIIDRVFIDENDQYWIIDYKTTKPTQEQSLEDFLQTEKIKHQSQLEQYAALLSKLNNTVNIRLGLYFPMIPAWIDCDLP